MPITRRTRPQRRWRLVAPNGQETAASGQHFASHYDAKRAAEEVKAHAGVAEITEEQPCGRKLAPGRSTSVALPRGGTGTDDDCVDQTRVDLAIDRANAAVWNLTRCSA